jgi:hypothetical protein
MVRIISAIALLGALGACTLGHPPQNTATAESSGSGALVGCLVTIPIGCAPGAVVGAAAGGAVGATGNAVAVNPPPQSQQAAYYR